MSAFTIISGSKQDLAYMLSFLLSHMKQQFRVTQHEASLTQLGT